MKAKSFGASLAGILCLTSTLLTATAWADLGDLPWNELEQMASDYRIEIRWPVVGGYNVNTLCSAGADLRTRKPVDLCTQWKDVTRRGNLYDGIRFECVAHETRVDSFPRASTRRECVDLFYPRPSPKYDGPVCRRYEDVTHVAPLTYSVEIYKATWGGSFAPKLLAKKQFDIPACE